MLVPIQGELTTFLLSPESDLALEMASTIVCRPRKRSRKIALIGQGLTREP